MLEHIKDQNIKATKKKTHSKKNELVLYVAGIFDIAMAMAMPVMQWYAIILHVHVMIGIVRNLLR